MAMHTHLHKRKHCALDHTGLRLCKIEKVKGRGRRGMEGQRRRPCLPDFIFFFLQKLFPAFPLTTEQLKVRDMEDFNVWCLSFKTWGSDSSLYNFRVLQVEEVLQNLKVEFFRSKRVTSSGSQVFVLILDLPWETKDSVMEEEDNLATLKTTGSVGVSGEDGNRRRELTQKPKTEGLDKKHTAGQHSTCTSQGTKGTEKNFQEQEFSFWFFFFEKIIFKT